MMRCGFKPLVKKRLEQTVEVLKIMLNKFHIIMMEMKHQIKVD